MFKPITTKYINEPTIPTPVGDDRLVRGLGPRGRVGRARRVPRWGARTTTYHLDKYTIINTSTIEEEAAVVQLFHVFAI